MPEYRVSYHDFEDGIATLKLFKDEEFQEHLRYSVEELPDGATATDQYRPEFDDDGEIIALHYDEELTKQKRKEFDEGIEKYKDMLDEL
jgi:hypothetical protein